MEWKGIHVSLWVAGSKSASAATEWRIAVSRKVVRLAAERNRWKRRIREVLRLRKDSISGGHKARLKVHQGGRGPKYAELEREILELLNLAGLYQK